MTEYWVSKKQYWCKYCSIFIRDDAPSRKQHETGLKHQGNKERFIRDLYKSGTQAKNEKAAEAAQMARIERSAEAAYAHDVHPSSSKVRLHPTATFAPASASRTRDKPKDAWANYTSAKDMGFDDEDTQKSSYEIEQMLKGRAGDVGAWEEVVERPVYSYTGDEPLGANGKRKLGEYDVKDEEDVETFTFRPRDKRPVRDVYDDDDWDPKAALGGLKLKKREEASSPPEAAKVSAEPENGLDRSQWTGKLELDEGHASGPSTNEVKVEERGQWQSVDPTLDAPAEFLDVKPSLAPVPEPLPDTTANSSESTSLFKKRRPVASRKK